jgi:hypothetical protein
MLVICSSVLDDCGSWLQDAANAAASIVKPTRRIEFMKRLPS